MRKFLIIGILTVNTLCCYAQKRFHVDFSVEDCPKKRALSFFFDDGEKLIPAQVTTKGNQYSIEGTYFSKFTFLEVRERKDSTLSFSKFFLLGETPAKIEYNTCDTINTNICWKNIRCENVKNFRAIWDSIYLFSIKEYNEFNERFNETIKGVTRKNKLAFDLATTKLFDKQFEYIKSNSSDYMSFVCFKDIVGRKQVFDSDNIWEIFNSFPKDIRNSFEGKKLAQHIDKQRKRYDSSPKVGRQAPDFQAIDVLGKDVKLTDFKGKHTLLVFWATWCGPCVQEIPTVKKIRKTYKPSELSIVYVSKDDDKTKMLSFIKKRELNWTHIFGNQSIPNDYFVEGIPETVLIDPNGKIIYINLGADTEELSEKLAEGIKNYKNVAR